MDQFAREAGLHHGPARKGASPMSHMTFRMMMDSGVLRPSAREIRRGPGGVPLFAMSPLPDFVNHSLDVLFGQEEESRHRIKAGAAAKPEVKRPVPPAQNVSFAASIRKWLLRLGLVDETRPPASPEKALPQLQVARLEERVKTLESLLKAEKILNQAQRDELGKLRARNARIDHLEADLATERESGKQLVQWLLEAEQELARVQATFNEIHPTDRPSGSPLYTPSA